MILSRLYIAIEFYDNCTLYTKSQDIVG